MAAAGGAASIITQVQQGGPATVNTLAGTRITRSQTLAPNIAYANSGYRCWRGRAYHLELKVY